MRKILWRESVSLRLPGNDRRYAVAAVVISQGKDGRYWVELRVSPTPHRSIRSKNLAERAVTRLSQKISTKKKLPKSGTHEEAVALARATWYQLLWSGDPDIVDVAVSRVLYPVIENECAVTILVRMKPESWMLEVGVSSDDQGTREKVEAALQGAGVVGRELGEVGYDEAAEAVSAACECAIPALRKLENEKWRK